MYRFFKSSFVLVIFAMSFSSCSYYYPLTIEQKNLPKVNIPANIQSLTVMNRSLTEDFQNLDDASLKDFFHRNNYYLKAFIMDSLAADTCLQVIGELLTKSGRFEIVVPAERNIKRGLEYFRIEQPLDWKFVDSVCQTYNTDGLLVMEKFVTQLSTLVQKNYDVAQSDLDVDDISYSGSYDFVYDTFFRMYYPEKNEIVGEFFVTDTISWYTRKSRITEIYSKMPSIKNGLIDAGINTAIDLNNNISPIWTPDTRGIFILVKSNKNEINLISNNEWQKLAEYWLPFTENQNKTIRSKAEYNMAIASELSGNFDDAILWASKSYHTLLRNRAFDYIQKLKLRKAELEKIERVKNQPFNF